MPVSSSWTFGNLRSDEKGLKPMPIEGAAASGYATQATTWWGSLGMATKIAIGATASALLVTAIVVPIVVVASSSDDDSSPTSSLTLRALTYTCANNATSPDYAVMVGATGSSHWWKPAWEGTLYAKDPDGSGSGGCVTSYTYYAGWPPVTSNSSTVPAVPSGASNMKLSMVLDNTTGYYHLAHNGCILYYYDSNTADAWWQGITSVWPVLAADGSWKTAAPVCS